ncbi:40848_t:CDS:2 [Gigaspora margarita]|uniref:40848_t:CDS:1 n=1 Tax=Gigaspora margarita TaxID=4874 RepID=A0ABN7URH9_GIGMA|nr:40848_t:CDS:2 [Gigaspora margarita]
MHSLMKNALRSIENQESKNTFDEFTYENEELDEKEEYYTLEIEDELDIYDNHGEKDDSIPPTTAEEKEWLLSLANLIYEGHKDQLFESDDPDVYNNEGAAYMGESTIGVEFSNSESDGDNNWPCGVKTCLGTEEDIDDPNQGWEDIECEIFIGKKETECGVFMMNEDKESKNEEGLENRLSEEKEGNSNQKEGDEYVNTELTKNSTPRNEREENEVFVVFVSDDDDDKTVQG